jgi:hypothetical protein
MNNNPSARRHNQKKTTIHQKPTISKRKKSKAKKYLQAVQVRKINHPPTKAVSPMYQLSVNMIFSFCGMRRLILQSTFQLLLLPLPSNQIKSALLLNSHK